MACPDRENFIEAIMEYLQNKENLEDLHRLLSEDEEWEKLVTEADLSRDEVNELREALKELATYMSMEDKEMPQEDQLGIESLLNEFPQMKMELEERIQKLYALADEVDKVHRDCTISEVVASSTGAVSGILTILGLSLAPLTAGVSLVLSATGIGLGTAAAITSVSTSVVEFSSIVSAKVKASQLLATDVNIADVGKEAVGQNIPNVASLISKCSKAQKVIGKNVRAIKLAKDSPRLAATAKRLMTTGKISARGSKQVQKAFEGTPLAVTKNARILGTAAAVVFLAMDVASLVQKSKHLHEGAKAELAAELRQEAQTLEKELEQLAQRYESLQLGLAQ
ncbi:apolipoprotein L2-like [Nycticebus coucang]|uniref:apolipoprotein L2-like n=1 Tax=Nycticebus coucang TaxID=9470 RepID=UPI00234CA788|nr:apolipoprotein L2-like [Nycticebus coucang]XP_053441758.1 apolipoprotein L2-like [Nycticebus coucang]XP_053441759.1 apolipoprotein L2-like [Nycticebus coucang]XP_053441760.1 apolipoprotein L2-like [Nycticebus coucang]